MVKNGKKGCASCGNVYPVERFQKQKTKLGYRASCKYCRHMNDRKKDAKRYLSEDGFWHKHETNKFIIIDSKNKIRNREGDRVNFIKYTYKVEFKEALDLYKRSTEGVCEICTKEPKENRRALAVDHCHTTGKIIGILCQDCNTAIGFLKDDTKIMKKAIEYLNK